MAVADAIHLGDEVTLVDTYRRNVQSAGASMQVNCRNGMVGVFNGSIPAGAVMQLPLHAPLGFTGQFYFPNPGTEAIDFSAFVIGQPGVPTHTSGKAVLYEWQRIPVDATPANDVYVLTGFSEA